MVWGGGWRECREGADESCSAFSSPLLKSSLIFLIFKKEREFHRGASAGSQFSYREHSCGQRVLEFSTRKPHPGGPLPSSRSPPCKGAHLMERRRGRVWFQIERPRSALLEPWQDGEHKGAQPGGAPSWPGAILRLHTLPSTPTSTSTWLACPSSQPSV